MEPVIEFRPVHGDLRSLYGCSKCPVISRQIELARQCCSCIKCGAERDSVGYVVCKKCRETAELNRKQKQAEELAALPIEEYDGGPVFAEGSYYSDLDDALDYCEDVEPKDLIVHPCDIRKASIPSLVDFVEEQLYEQLDDQEGPFLSREDTQALEVIEKSLTMPTYWMVRDNARLRRT